jgi:hypothetical protein
MRYLNDRSIDAQSLAFQTSGASVKVDPWLVTIGFPEGRFHRTIFDNRARVTVPAHLRIDKCTSH